MLYVYTVLYVCTVGRAGATRHPPPIYLNVTHFTKFYNINQLPRYAVIPPMSHGVLNNNMMGVVGLCYIYNRGEPYNSIVHIISNFVKSFAK